MAPVTDKPTDAEVIEASLREPEAFRVIFERHYAAVYRLAARRVGRDVAGDVAAETFLRSFANRYRYDLARHNALPWLYGIAVNVIGDHLRKAARMARFAGRFLRNQADLDPTVESDDRLVASSVRQELAGALEALSAGDRDALLLFALEGLSYSEIASVLEIPVGTVGSRVHRARKRIRKLIPGLEERVGILFRNDERDDEPGT